MRAFVSALAVTLFASIAFAQQQPNPTPPTLPPTGKTTPGPVKPESGNIPKTGDVTGGTAAPKKPQSFDVTAIDKSVDPCEDFYRFACGNWMKNNPIPADKTSWGRFNELTEYNRSVLHKILDDLSQQKHLSGNDKKLADYYTSCMDESAIDAKGLAPLKPQLDMIARMKTKQDLTPVLAKLHDNGTRALFTFFARPELHDATKEAGWAVQGGLGLPNRDYYLKDDPKSAELRTKYQQHVANMFKLLGDPADKAEAEAKTVMDLETKLAESSMAPVELRDTRKLDHWMSVDDFAKLAPAIDWNKYFAELHAPEMSNLNVGMPEFYKTVQTLVDSVPLDQWKTYLRWHLVNSNASMLPTAFVNENFDFYGKTLNGAEKLEPRWERCVQATDGDLGEALGKKYVDLTFGAEGKARTLAMVQEIEKQMGADINQLDWMTPDTKKAALAKLHEVTNKICYPDQWRDYSKYHVKKGDALGNSERGNSFEYHRRLNKIGGPVDKKEWGMTPPTVNAYYNPTENNINFPAGILQPPFYDQNIGDPVNLGGIGAVIGHELTHGFDDSGRRYDGEGNLRDWWTQADGEAFDKRAECEVNEYNQFVAYEDPSDPKSNVNTNGKLTLGENTADNGGLRLAYMVMMDKLAGKEAPEKDGYTAPQQFFIGWAQVWCQNIRPARARTLALGDPHSLGRFRANGVVRNMEQFQKAFNCKTGQPMAPPPEQRCRVW